ncbi:LytS/YhcK type 5TM receptor domain-containing protein [Amphibacillus cookii]|uniref:LytS/YhcK type 5TM receptor domain-containing protein n=1 Tax=Amphibacillus cookii TaxID=767787 RepID=UPI00195E93E4|nr:LytS/YhcK type 5TM receptor domain-containing protein [Amphibacillus cookii]MBM7542038.1 two-component system sensor histidine kinase LytS [Amphibacillus cookii]
MLEILFMMLERLGIIVTIAFVVTRLQFSRNMLTVTKMTTKQTYAAMVFFGVFGIIGTYSGFALSLDTFQYERSLLGIETNEAIANFRVIGVVLAGIFGGYKVGGGAGLIAGGHRFLLGGYTGLACGLASIIAGLLGGLYNQKYKQMPSIPVIILLGALAETIQMVMIIILSRPLDRVIALVQMIGFPMIIANGLGCGLFLLIIKSVQEKEDRVGASHAQQTLRIADQTIKHLRNGLTAQSAEVVCNILFSETKPIAVAITNQSDILAHIGQGSDHHRSGDPIQTEATREVIHNGEIDVTTKKGIHCDHPNCTLRFAVIAPLKSREKTIGTLKIYYADQHHMKNAAIELVSGLSVLLSNQIELSEAEEAYQLAQKAEINALQAQMSPHFMFNSLSAVNALIRIDPNKAREMIQSLSQFIRQNIKASNQRITTIEAELSHIKSYLTIEETRFSERLQINYDIDATALQTKLPPLTLQPIVENAIKHGIKDIERSCSILIAVKTKREHVEIMIKDDGKGIARDQLTCIGNKIIDSKTGTGVGLYNINRRLELTFGHASALQIKSEENNGTTVSFSVPRLEGSFDE